MSVTARRILLAAAVAGASGVAIGAFGAHGLPDFLATQYADADLVDRRMEQFETGARYHLIHALALLCLAAIASLTEIGSDSNAAARPPRALVSAAVLFTLGIVFFSGSLYLLVVTNTPWLGAITPIGGLAWIIAWLLLAFIRPVAKSSSIQ